MQWNTIFFFSLSPSLYMCLERFQGKLPWKSMKTTLTAQQESQCYEKKSLLRMEHFFFFSSGRKEGVKRSNNFVSVQHCCIKEPHKNKRKFSVKGNLQPIPKINKMEWKIQNLSITLTVKYSNFNRLPFKYKLILCYNMYNAQLSGL